MIIRDAISVIKEKISVEEVVAKYVSLEKSGRNLRGRCPFHSEKTPSFYVSLDRNRYHCFGCAKSGDVISFIQEVEGLSFMDVIKDFSQQLGIVLEFDGKDSGPTKDNTEYLKKILEVSSKVFEKKLEACEEAKNYLLEKRGITQEFIKKFRIGYAPFSQHLLTEFLTSKKIPPELSVMSGMLGMSERGTFYDTFKERIMFPIRDRRSDIIGFTGRIFPLPGSTTDITKIGKYVNTRETPLYQKQRVLYGIEFAQREIVKKGRVILVEGQIDVIMMHQAGYMETVGVSGTAFTESHAKIISQLSDNIIILFDSDSAGRKAIENALKLLIPHNVNIIVGRINDGKDPADYVQGGGDVEEILNNTVSVAEFFAELLPETMILENMNDIIHKKIFPIIEIYSPLLREGFIRSLSKHSQVSKDILDQEFAAYLQKHKKRNEPEYEVKKEYTLESLGGKEKTPSEEMLKILLYGKKVQGLETPGDMKTYIKELQTEIPEQDEEYEKRFTEIELLLGEDDNDQFVLEVLHKAYKDHLQIQRKNLLIEIKTRSDDQDLLTQIKRISEIIDKLSK